MPVPFSDDTSLTVVIPAYNEVDSLTALLPELLDYCRERGWQVILVDDGSIDGTRKLLEQYDDQPGFQVIRHKLNRGYGGALKTGLAKVTTPYAVTMDADGQHTIADIEQLLQASLEVEADLVVGRREGYGGSRYRAAGRWLIRGIARALVPFNVHDLNSGFKLYRASLVQRYLHLCPDSMAFSDIITLVFVYRRHLVIEHPVQVQPRQAGRSTISTRTALETVMEILNIIMLFHPMRIFLPAALFCIFVGVAWGLPIVLMGRGVSVGSMLAIVTGMIMLFLGLVAEQLSLLRLESLDARSGE